MPSYVIGFDSDNINALLNALKSKDDTIANETIALFDLLQMNPRIKKYISETISKIKNIDVKALDSAAGTSIAKEAAQANGPEWQKMMQWEPDCNLNNTYYMLMCLRDLTTPKPSTQSGMQMSNARIVRQQSVPQQAQAQQ